MEPITYETDGVPIQAWVKGVELAENALAQLRNTAQLPFVHSHVAVMPDAHWGLGSTVGSVIPTVGAIVPAAVGVDIGCGMCAVRTSLSVNDFPDNLSGLREKIELAVPHGRSGRRKRPTKGERNREPQDKGSWAEVPRRIGALWDRQLAQGLCTNVAHGRSGTKATRPRRAPGLELFLQAPDLFARALTTPK